MDNETFKEFLNKKNLRLTAQRIAILNAISRDEDRHLSAGEIFNILKETNPGIGIATIYKNLRLLEQEGIITKIELLDKTAHYEISDAKSVHCHLICSKCGKIIEVRGTKVRYALNILQSGSNFTFQQGNFNFFGICKDCTKMTEPVIAAAVSKAKQC